MQYKNQKIYLDEEDVSEAIRGLSVTNNVSTVCSYQGVREEMVNLQKKYGSAEGIIMDGRDIGTVVLPDATVKIYLTALRIIVLASIKFLFKFFNLI